MAYVVSCRFRDLNRLLYSRIYAERGRKTPNNQPTYQPANDLK